METEYIRSLHSNYQRFLLAEKPEEKRYQYCMVNRGGIRGLLSCSLRYLNGNAYLYYDITSKQNIVQLFQKELITREWMQDFLWGMKRLSQELGRFLLQERNVLWEPEQIFQDLEKNEFSFIYYPYYEGENHFLQLLSFFVEHIDYEDELLVEYVYRIYEQYEKNGEVYLQEKIYEDMDILSGKNKKNVEKNEKKEMSPKISGISEERVNEKEEEKEAMYFYDPYESVNEKQVENGNSILEEEVTAEEKEEQTHGRKSLLSLFDVRKNKQREKAERDEFKNLTNRRMEGLAVAEKIHYDDEEFGRTVFLDAPKEEQEVFHRLYSQDGRIFSQLENPTMLIGKSKEKVDLYLEDLSVSRMHAKVIRTKDKVSLEDLNSTNGTFINGNRLQPYERVNLEPGDRIQIGNVELNYR